MKKTLIALGAAVALLAVVLLKNRSDNRSMRADAFVFDTTQKSEVEYLKVVEKTDTAELRKTGGQWGAARDSFPGDTAKIHKSLGYLLSLQDKEMVSTSAARLAEYGLDSAQVKRVEWRVGGKTVKVALGKTSGTDYSSTYWKWEDKPEVYRTPGNFSWEFAGRIGDWKERILVKIDSKEIRSVQVDWIDSTRMAFHYVLEPVNDSTYRLIEPDTMAVRRDMGQGVVNRAGELSIDEFAAANDTNLAKVNLDSPMVVVKVNLKSGKSVAFKSGREIGNYFYVQHPSRKDVVKLAAWRFDPFRKKPFEFADTKTPAAAANAIAPPAAAKPHRAK